MTDQRIHRQRPPKDILDLAHARREARADRDWIRADELRDEIEAAGWKVVDRGVDFELAPARAPDVEEGHQVRYGSSESVPSRLDEPATTVASVILTATDWPDDLDRALQGLGRQMPAWSQVVLVANAPSSDQQSAIEQSQWTIPGAELEVVWTSARMGHAAALNAGIRRATGGVVILLDTSVEPRGDFVTALTGALEDPGVAVTGPWGLRSRDLRHFEEGAAGEVDAIEGYVQAFRRSDYVDRGQLDEHFRFYRNLDIWWSLVLRDEGVGKNPRRALQLAGLPLERHEKREYSTVPPEERDRLSKRNFYRIIDRFGRRRDLVVAT
jgi:hypothetical protein